MASKAQGVIVVVGASSDSIRQSLQGLPVAFIENRLWQEGLSSSIRCGLEGLWGSDAVLLMLCDQPEVTTSLLDTMIDTFQSGNHPIVACEYSGTVGVPAIFPKQFFSELEGLSGDRGAKPLLNRHLKDIARIPFSGGVLDIDRPEDLDRLRS